MTFVIYPFLYFIQHSVACKNLINDLRKQSHDRPFFSSFPLGSSSFRILRFQPYLSTRVTNRRVKNYSRHPNFRQTSRTHPLVPAINGHPSSHPSSNWPSPTFKKKKRSVGHWTGDGRVRSDDPRVAVVVSTNLVGGSLPDPSGRATPRNFLNTRCNLPTEAPVVWRWWDWFTDRVQVR